MCCVDDNDATASSESHHVTSLSTDCDDDQSDVDEHAGLSPDFHHQTLK